MRAYTDLYGIMYASMKVFVDAGLQMCMYACMSVRLSLCVLVCLCVCMSLDNNHTATQTLAVPLDYG